MRIRSNESDSNGRGQEELELRVVYWIICIDIGAEQRWLQRRYLFCLSCRVSSGQSRVRYVEHIDYILVYICVCKIRAHS